MTPIRVGPDAIFHRFHSPDWAHLPTSGAGAAVNGGRFNRPGVEALYLSVEPETALAEYRQSATITPPATLVAYRVDVDGVVDFSGGYDPEAWSDDWAEVGCDWKYIARIERHDPPTWRRAHPRRVERLIVPIFPALWRNQPRAVQCQPGAG